MKRYFLVADSEMPQLGETFGHWAGITLGSHGKAGDGHHVVVLLDEHVEPRDSWIEMPSLYDSRTTMADHGHHEKLADVGVKPTHTAIEMAKQLQTINRTFRP